MERGPERGRPNGDGGPRPGRTTRRSFAAAGVVLAAAGVGAGTALRARRSDDPAPLATRAAPPAPSAAPPAAAPLAPEGATVGQLRRALDGGALSAEELVGWALARIADLDGGEAGLGAVIETNPDAARIARARDRELGAGNRRGPLHGVPVLVKDLFATDDAMATTAGSRALLGNRAVRDAAVVARLRRAGAVVLGKTNLTEWSNFRGSAQVSGWSARGGQTRNPYRRDVSPWGSSSGSAVAVAAGYAPLALGVETNGSIVCPASATATVGLKPTVGLTSRAGVIPLSWTQDSPGPMARTVADVALLLSVIAGPDEAGVPAEVRWTAPDPALADPPVDGRAGIDYARYLDPDGLRGARIGVVRDLCFDADATALLDKILPTLAAAGAEVVDPVAIPSLATLAPGDHEYAVLTTEFPLALERYLAEFTPDGPLRTLADVVAFYEANAAEELARFDQQNFYRALEAGSVGDVWYQETAAQGLALAREGGLDAALDGHRLDALLAPTIAAPTPIGEHVDDWPGACTQPSAMAGYPILNVPLGYVGGLPVGLSFMGRAWSEPTLLRLGCAFERLHPARRPPEVDPGA